MVLLDFTLLFESVQMVLTFLSQMLITPMQKAFPN